MMWIWRAKPPIVLTSVTPGVLRNCGRTTQSCRVRRSVAVHGVPSGFTRIRLGLDRVHEDLAQAGGDRAHLRLEARGQLRLDLLQAFAHLLAREVQVGAVLEHHGHLRQAVARDRTRVVQSRQAGHRGLDREGDALLGFQRRIAGRLGVDLHLDIGDVGRGVDRQLGEAPARRARPAPSVSASISQRWAMAKRMRRSSTPRVRLVRIGQWSCEAPDFSMSAFTR